MLAIIPVDSPSTESVELSLFQELAEEGWLIQGVKPPQKMETKGMKAIEVSITFSLRFVVEGEEEETKKIRHFTITVKFSGKSEDVDLRRSEISSMLRNPLSIISETTPSLTKDKEDVTMYVFRFEAGDGSIVMRTKKPMDVSASERYV